ncbi:MAG TPA: hypothetical protein VEQ60_01700, partial [Longimicrobium sp.]|nr:hypothetical protein [Longimicrobium sp.]
MDPVRQPARDPAGWENDRRHHPEKARWDAQGRKDPRSLRNCYLTEDDEEIAAAVTQPVRRLGVTVQGTGDATAKATYGRGGPSKSLKQTYTKTYTP